MCHVASQVLPTFHDMRTVNFEFELGDVERKHHLIVGPTPPGCDRR